MVNYRNKFTLQWTIYFKPLLLARFPNLANVKVIVNFTINGHEKKICPL